MKKNDFLTSHFNFRKSKLFVGLLLSLFTLLIVGTLSYIKKPQPIVGKVNISGIINDRNELLEKLEEIRSNDNIKGLIATVNSPGGTYVSSKELFESVKNLSQKIPTVVYMKEMATSGAFLVSLGFDKIFCNEGTITGSVGVILQTADLTELLQKIGVNPVIIKSGELKAVPNPLEEINQNKIDYISDLIVLMQKQFLKIVKDTRKLSEDTLSFLSDGRILVGSQALEMKLVDEIGSEKDALDWLKSEIGLGDEIMVIDYSEQDNIFKMFDINFIKSKIRSSNITFNNGLFTIWKP